MKERLSVADRITLIFAAACITVGVYAIDSRFGTCGLMQSVRAVILDYGDSERARQIDRSCRVIESAGTDDLLKTPYGSYWIPKRNRNGVVQQLAERERDAYWSARIRKGDIVLDCGANVGTFSRLALDRGASQVVAIEPAPENIECLRKTFPGEIASGRIVIYPKGVWDKEGVLTMNASRYSSGLDSLVFSETAQPDKFQIPVTTIDRLTSELRLPHVDFIKMDIEGSERQALRGGVATIARFRPHLTVAVEHFEEDAEQMPAYIRQLWPAMRTQCGPCEVLSLGNVDAIRPEVVWADQY